MFANKKPAVKSATHVEPNPKLITQPSHIVHHILTHSPLITRNKLENSKKYDFFSLSFSLSPFLLKRTTVRHPRLHLRL
jgi:hypothetical protein